MSQISSNKKINSVVLNSESVKWYSRQYIKSESGPLIHLFWIILNRKTTLTNDFEMSFWLLSLRCPSSCFYFNEQKKKQNKIENVDRSVTTCWINNTSSNHIKQNQPTDHRQRRNDNNLNTDLFGQKSYGSWIHPFFAPLFRWND